MPIKIGTKFSKQVIESLSRIGVIYDLELPLKIEELYKKDKSGNLIPHTNQEWSKFIKDVDIKIDHHKPDETKHIMFMQMAIAKHPLLSYIHQKELLSIDNVRNETVLEFLKQKDLSNDIYEMAYKKISPITLNNALNINIFNKYPLNEYVVELILDDEIKNLNTYGKFSYPERENIFKYTDNNNKINNLLNSNIANDLPESVLTNIATNENINMTIRDMAFDICCNWEELNNITPHMAKTMYQSVVPYLFHDDNDGVPNGIEQSKVRVFARDIIKKSLQENLLWYEQEIDFINRIKSEPPGFKDENGQIFATFLKYNNDEKSLMCGIDIIQNTLPDKASYTNAFMSNKHFHHTKTFEGVLEMLYREIKNVNNFPNKYRLDMLKTVLRNAKIEEKLLSHITKDCIKILNENEYTENTKEQCADILISIIKSAHTPQNILLEIKNMKLNKSNLMLFNNIMLACKTQTKHIQKYASESIADTFQYDYETDNFSLNINKETNYDINIDVLNYAKDMTSKFSFKNQNKLSELIKSMEHFKKKDCIYKAKHKIDDIEQNIRSISSFSDVVNFYINATNIEKEYYNLQDEQKDKTPSYEEER